MIVTVNAGSSSLKFAAFEPPLLRRRFAGRIEQLGSSSAKLFLRRGASLTEDRTIDVSDMERAARELSGVLHAELGGARVTDVAHRIVHGGARITDHCVITDDVAAALHACIPMDPAHMPAGLALMSGLREAIPTAVHTACLDTAFFRTLPAVAARLPIARSLADQGIRRYGFHGLSYAFLMERLAEVAGHDAANGRVVLAHLGSGASMAAVRGGVPLDTTMGFTPAAGLVMGNRPGDLDPGLVPYLLRTGLLAVSGIESFVNRECGLLASSESSADVRDLLARRNVDPRAAEAIAVFCHQAKKFLGAMTATLNGLDTLVFSGGIGERAPQIRAEICQGLEYLGVAIDAARNASNAGIISSSVSRVAVHVIPTDEEAWMAQIVRTMTGNQRG